MEASKKTKSPSPGGGSSRAKSKTSSPSLGAGGTAKGNVRAKGRGRGRGRARGGKNGTGAGRAGAGGIGDLPPEEVIDLTPEQRAKLQADMKSIYAKLLDYKEILPEFDNQERYLSELFKEKPSKKLYPDYYAIIQIPISLKEIKKKITAFAYYKVEQFMNDLKLMFKNAKTYNQEGSIVYNDAVKLEEIADSEFKNVKRKREEEETKAMQAKQKEQQEQAKQKQQQANGSGNGTKKELSAFTASTDSTLKEASNEVPPSTANGNSITNGTTATELANAPQAPLQSSVDLNSVSSEIPEISDVPSAGAAGSLPDEDNLSIALDNVDGLGGDFDDVGDSAFPSLHND